LLLRCLIENIDEVTLSQVNPCHMLTNGRRTYKCGDRRKNNIKIGQLL